MVSLKSRSSRLGYVDSIRGIAALTVIYYHAAETMLKGGTTSGIEQAMFSLWMHWIDLGKISVALFFAVSGFVIPYSLLRGSARPIRSFVISRFFRLYPAYWISIAAAVFFFWLAGRGVPDVSVIGVNVTMLQQFVGIPNVMELYWTLQIALIFYVLCVILFVMGFLRSSSLVLKTALGMIGLALLLAILRWVTDKGVPVAVGMALSMMFFGLLWRRATLDADAVASRGVRIFLLAFIPLVPAISWLGYGDSWMRYTITYWSAITLFILLTTKIKLSHPGLVYMGAISYSLYLFGPVAAVITQLTLPSGVGGIWNGHLFALVNILVTIPIAMLVYHVVEKPAVALGHAIANRTAAPLPAQ